MAIRFDPAGSPENLQEMIQSVSSLSGVSGLMILACDANGFTPAGIDPILSRASVPVFGGVFPAIIYGREMFRHGSLVIGLPNVLQTMFIPDLSNRAIDYEASFDCKIPGDESALTMMVFVDGFAKRICAFVESLFNKFGFQMNYIGGGAGSLSMAPKPCLFTNQGMVADGAVLALIGLASGVGVSHGWTHMSGPYRVTSSDLNVITTLDWRPALDVHREVVEAHSGMTLDVCDLDGSSKSYPFGISRLESEHIVRSPVRADSDKSLICVGEVPQGAFVSILNGDESSLIRAAGNALDLALKAFPTQCEPGLKIFMDGICRVLLLGERFAEELKSVCTENEPLVGACTIGEIANCGTEFLEFYNKTAVVAVLEAR
ncbi:MAG: FIST N-terminal domain-containing protein [Syntrophobacteraceae bacterium]